MKAFITKLMLVLLVLALGLSGGAPSPASAKLAERVNIEKSGLTSPASRLDLDLIDQFGGTTRIVAVQGSLALAGIGPRLVILDITDPQHPQAIGTGPIWPYYLHITDIEIAGQYAYVLNEHQGLKILDISDPTQPVQVAWYDSPCIAMDIEIAGDLAFIAEDCGGMSILDISDPTQPELLSVFEDWGPPNYIWSVTLVANVYVYCYAYPWGFKIVDVSDPTNPVIVSSYAIKNLRQVSAAAPSNGLVDGNYLYINGYEWLYIFDITDPVNPVFISNIFEGWYFTKSGDYIYTIAGQFGVGVYDVSDVYNPVEVGRIPTDDWATGASVSGNILAVTADERGVKFYDISEPSDPIEISQFVSPGAGRGLIHHIIGDVLYFGDEYFGLRTFDLADPVYPQALGEYELPPVANRQMYDMDFDGSTACLVAYDSGMRMVDISNPAQLTELGVYQPPAGIWIGSVDCVGDLAYVGLYNSTNVEIRLLDISDPGNPLEIGSHFIDGFKVPELFVVGTLLYAIYDGDLLVLDYSNLQEPVEIDRLDGPGFWGFMTFDGDTAYISAGYEKKGLAVVDISDPRNVTQVYFQETPVDVSTVNVTDSYLVLTLVDEGIRIWDKNAGYPFQEIAGYAMYGSYTSVLDGDLIYHYTDSGIHVLQMEEISAIYLPLTTK